MLKGIQKNVMVVRLMGSPCFEAAYFVIRAGKKEPKHGDMVKEANRIISESDPHGTAKGSRVLKRWERAMLVLYGALGGGFAVAGVWLGFILFG